MMWNYFGHMGLFGFGWIFMIIFWALVLWLILAFVHGASGYGRGHGHGCDGPKEDDAMRILRQRYAKGEISEEEFDKMKECLSC